jgi:predicted transcriptional regulator
MPMGVRKYMQLSKRSGQGVEKLLGELELEVMRVIWVRKTVTVRDVLGTLATKRPLAYTTVMTIMGRLAEKGLLAVDRQSKTHFYRAVYTQEEFEAQAAGKAVDSLIADFGSEPAIRQFVERLSAVDPDQLQQLAEMARQAQEGQDEA